MDTTDDALVARHGWATLMALLRLKGLITEDEALMVTQKAHEGAARARDIMGRSPPSPNVP